MSRLCSMRCFCDLASRVELQVCAGVKTLQKWRDFRRAALPATPGTTVLVGNREAGSAKRHAFALPLNHVFFLRSLQKRQRGRRGDEVSRSFSAPGGLQPVLGDGETPPSGKRTSSPPTPDVSYPQTTLDQFSPQ